MQMLKSRAELGWKADTSLTEALKTTWQWQNIWKVEINNKTILESVHRNIIRLHNLMQKIKKFLVFLCSRFNNHKTLMVICDY